MTTILNAREYLDRLLKKDQRGNVVSGEDFNLSMNIAQSEHTDSLKRKAEATSDIIESLRSFMVTSTHTTSSGYITIPTNPEYLKLLKAQRYYDDGSKYVTCDEVTQLEKGNREDNSLTVPTDKHPVVSAEGLNLYFLPSAMKNVKITYYRKPSPLYLDWYFDDNNEIQYLSEGQVYTSSAGETYSDGTVHPFTKTSLTQDFEWTDDSDRIAIVHRVLMKLGVTIPNEMAMQYAASETMKNEAKV